MIIALICLTAFLIVFFNVCAWAIKDMWQEMPGHHEFIVKQQGK